jgi:predicted nucleic acid-binding Zn ribbon protein
VSGDDSPAGSGPDSGTSGTSGPDSGTSGPDPGTSGPDPGTSGPDSGTGIDAVRSALNRARAAAAARGLKPGAAPERGTASRRRRFSGEVRTSGAHPDARDPQTVASSIDRLVAERGWSAPVAVGGVIGRWEAVVGAETAAHCTPESFGEGVLTVRTDSTAWATQLRLLLPNLMRRLAEEVGESTVTKIVVRGPSGPSWRRGLRVAPGSQGPRDTYG